jgi:hypothetical protein
VHSVFSFRRPFSGLGLVAMGSLLPITFVQFLVCCVRLTVAKNSIHILAHANYTPWYEQTGAHELIETAKIAIPLIVAFIMIIKLYFKTDLPMVCLRFSFFRFFDFFFRFFFLFKKLVVSLFQALFLLRFTARLESTTFCTIRRITFGT